MNKTGKQVRFCHSIRFKFAMSYTAIIAAILVLLNSYPIYTVESTVFQSKQVSLQNQASVVASALSGLGNLEMDKVGQVLDQLDHSGVNRLIVTEETGAIVYDTTENENTTGEYALLSEIALALQGKDVFRCQFSGDAFRSRAAVPVIYRGVLIGAVYLYEYDSEQAALLTELQSNLLRLSALTLVVAIAVCIIVTQSLTRRTGLLLQGIQATGSGTNQEKVEMGGKDEISLLADEFNQLTDRLSRTEEVRRRFVSDASHELKTPLASIRLLTDSILQTEGIDEATVKEFVGDIGEEAGRLTRITEKLLTLTRLDASAETSRESVDLNVVTDKVLHMLCPLADERKVTLQTEEVAECTVLANEDDVYQILFNLVENGIKYNISGGWVRVSLRRDGTWVYILVEDSGIGIPEEELPKIYDRFYRVDKARSRAAGGTGLGLSIVRDMVRKYGGEIQSGARLEGGTWFCVRLSGEETP